MGEARHEARDDVRDMTARDEATRGGSGLCGVQLAEVLEGLYLVAIPIPVPLRELNAYLLKGPHGWTLVDTGFHTPETERAWGEVFERLGIDPGAGDLEKLVVTHYHPDHIGMAGWLQRLAAGRSGEGPPVLMLEQELPQVERFWLPESAVGEQIAAMFVAHGMPAQVAAPVPGHHLEQVGRVSPLPRLTPVREGEQLRLGRWEFEVLWMPGHAEGLMVLWEPHERLLIGNDLVLQTITPNISLWPHSTEDPLAQYLESLGRVRGLPARLVLPGHRQLITDLAGRVEEIRRHHDDRLERVLSIAGGAGPAGATGWEVSLALFGPQRDLFALRFAMAEALAHLEHLVGAGRLERREPEQPGGAVRYRMVG